MIKIIMIIMIVIMRTGFAPVQSNNRQNEQSFPCLPGNEVEFWLLLGEIYVAKRVGREVGPSLRGKEWHMPIYPGAWPGDLLPWYRFKRGRVQPRARYLPRPPDRGFGCEAFEKNQDRHLEDSEPVPIFSERFLRK